MEIKDKLTVTRGERGGRNGERRGKVKLRSMDKDNGVGDCLWEWGLDGAGKSNRGKGGQL